MITISCNNSPLQGISTHHTVVSLVLSTHVTDTTPWKFTQPSPPSVWKVTQNIHKLSKWGGDLCLVMLWLTVIQSVSPSYCQAPPGAHARVWSEVMIVTTLVLLGCHLWWEDQSVHWQSLDIFLCHMYLCSYYMQSITYTQNIQYTY